MTDRYTVKDAERAMFRLAQKLGATVRPLHQGKARDLSGLAGEYVNAKFTSDYSRPGSWHLDYNPVYGGCVIAAICDDGHGESRPFGDRRLFSPRVLRGGALCAGGWSQDGKSLRGQ